MKNFLTSRYLIRLSGCSKKIVFMFALTAFFAKIGMAQISGDAERFFQPNNLEQSRNSAIKFGFDGKKLYNPFTLALAGLMYTYQSIISPQISASCMYNPSCSAFSKQLISRYGLFQGSILTADRLMRCNKLAAYDLRTSQISKSHRKVHETADIYCPHHH